MTTPFPLLDPAETRVIGRWVVAQGTTIGDYVTERIDWLVSETLEWIATEASGWEKLFRDPRDGRLWEQTYPQGEMHGGGPPTLQLIDIVTAQRKYRIGTSGSDLGAGAPQTSG